MKIAVIGLGYVGLPLAYHFEKVGHKVVGFDISTKRLEDLKNGIDITREIGEKIKDANILYTNSPEDIKDSEVIIVTVPTPTNANKDPDYTPLLKASETIGKVLKKGQIVVYESTVDPGATEEICLPVLEKFSNLKCPLDFKIGYSPERINPGDKEHTVDKIKKVVAGIDSETLDILTEMYESIISVGIHKASSIKVAEASKIIENTQRDINIAFMNELSMICDRLGINTFDVLEAAGTKWNFLKFTPGLVGGHCIGVDPYYLAQRAIKLGMNPEIILAGRRINDEMPVYTANQVVKMIIKSGKKVEGANILIMGLTFKENVPDFRNSKIGDTIKELKEFGLNIKAIDPYKAFMSDYDYHELNIEKNEVIDEVGNNTYDGIIYAQNHKEFENIDLKEIIGETSILFDIKGKFRKDNFKNYKSL
ncbi:nucleotide sugar dehydrogenase [Candidatus Gracilibacteria bacterium]|nr:nucleotide sugar dehydrogenase [Candidatus Gracilibacteria bacterium]